MRFMIIVRAAPDSERGVIPSEHMFAEMANYHEELKKVGILLDASGLQPSSTSWRIQYSGGKQIVVDRPFGETKELIAGYTLIQVKSREEALEWTARFENPVIDGNECQIEVRQSTNWKSSVPVSLWNAFARWESQRRRNERREQL